MKTTWVFAFIFLLNLNVFADTNLPAFQLVSGNIYRGGRPTEAGMKELKQKGITTIINLENRPEFVDQEAQWAKQIGGFKFLNFPMTYDTEPSDAMINQILSEMQRPENGFIYVHCKHGEDRTGLIIGLYRVEVEGWQPQAAYQEMLKLDFHPKYKPLDDYFRRKTNL